MRAMPCRHHGRPGQAGDGPLKPCHRTVRAVASCRIRLFQLCRRRSASTPLPARDLLPAGVEPVGVPLHHFGALLEILGMVAGRPHGVLLFVGKLGLNEIPPPEARLVGRRGEHAPEAVHRHLLLLPAHLAEGEEGCVGGEATPPAAGRREDPGTVPGRGLLLPQEL